MTSTAIAICIFIVLGVVALVALLIAALRSKPGFRRRGCSDFEGTNRRHANDCDDSITENISEMTSLDGTIIKTQQLKGNE